MISSLLPVSKTTLLYISSDFLGFPHQQNPCGKGKGFGCGRNRTLNRITYSSYRRVVCGYLPIDPWAPSIDSQSIASQLFAVSLIPYLGFLYFITKSKSAPKLTLFGFYFLLTFVGATIPAGIYAKLHYGTSLSNVDWLHGSAESLLTLTNLFIVMGLREALRKVKDAKKPKSVADIKEETQSSV
ncbi:1-acyl-sn-glycerol-3-phosphate acyltransferase [Tasmannia lanceolata]|uniref:1-acyl-sn-glycerol-3-phosphate acyltransferase n=1 Tax=Tasmannia lanceolata TaxID=3420 RepID=UPI004063FBB4